jgi:hypothetical protein
MLMHRVLDEALGVGSRSDFRMQQVGQISPDGNQYWDGQRWMPTLSIDGRWRWDGATWTPNQTKSSRSAAPTTSWAWDRGLGCLGFLSLVSGNIVGLQLLRATALSGGLNSTTALAILPVVSVAAGIWTWRTNRRWRYMSGLAVGLGAAGMFLILLLFVLGLIVSRPA